jgi:hypothetical protein
MRHAAFTLVIALMLSPAVIAKDEGDWRNVKKLKPGTSVTVDYWNGSRVRGRVESADDSELVLVPRYPNPYPRLARPIDRNAIRKIVRTGKTPKLPDVGKCALVGSLVVGAGSAIEEGARSSSGIATLFAGGLGALVGYSLGPMACAVAVMVSMPFALRPPKLVYEYAGPGPLPTLSP